MEKAVGRIVIEYEEGLHARPAAAFAHLASSRSDCEVTVICNDESVNGKSIMSLLTLGACHLSELTIEVEGESPQELLDQLLDLVRGRFNLQQQS